MKDKRCNYQECAKYYLVLVRAELLRHALAQEVRPQTVPNDAGLEDPQAHSRHENGVLGHAELPEGLQVAHGHHVGLSESPGVSVHGCCEPAKEVEDVG